MSLVALAAALAIGAPDDGLADDEPIEIGPPIDEAAPRGVELGARWTSHLRVATSDEPLEAIRARLGSTLALALSWSPEPRWHLALATRVRHRVDLASDPTRFDPGAEAELRRALVRWQLACRELTLGLDELRWGRTLSRPTDLVSPLDWREGPLLPEGGERLPVVLVALRQPLGAGALDLAWIPLAAENRFAPASHTPTPAADLGASGELALRLTQRVHALDLALGWRWGLDRAPALPAEARPSRSPRHHALGLELAGPLGPMRWAAESALLVRHRLFDHALAERHDELVRWALQLAWTPAIFLDLVVELEGAHALAAAAPTWHEGPDDLWLRSRLGLMLAFDGVLRLDAESRVGLRRDDWWVRIALAVRASEIVELGLGLTLFGGAPLDLGLGALYDDADHVWLRLSIAP